MPPIDESYVLIPVATLEDFPSKLSDYDARSLLAAWTVLWHPSLLAATGKLPEWQRADSPPEPKPGRLLVLPEPSAAQLPADFFARLNAVEQCHLVRGESRAEFLDQICQRVDADANPAWRDPPPLSAPGRWIAVADFYAAGYALLQIQVMTRRLRYTSNLDEIHLQRRIVDAAEAFRNGDAAEAVAALHDVFDVLAQERDHYFSSSDPHLVDLTLLTASTVNDLVDEIGTVDPDSQTDSSSESALPTPKNFLIDLDACRGLDDLDPGSRRRLSNLISSGEAGWAGGGPSATQCLDLLTLNQADELIREATSDCETTLARRPLVFGRFSGGWPGDLNALLVKQGYRGLIPIDFAAGTGHGDEAKVILESGGARLEGLTAKPIDAASDAAFLTLGTRLGEAIDSGEIATALLAHWPGQTCDSFGDFRRAATWSLCLGRFWRLDKYFQEGEHPYHQATVEAASKSAADWLESWCKRSGVNPLSALARDFRQAIAAEANELIAGLAGLVGRDRDAGGEPLQSLAAAIVGNSGRSQSAPAILIVNPAAVGYRATLQVPAKVSAESRHIFACSPQDTLWEVTVDVPGNGFVLLPAKQPLGAESQSVGPSIRSILTRHSRRRPIAETVRGDRSVRLQNEFMEVVINDTSGGVSGVYSGAVRGNRFSMKLVHQGGDQIEPARESAMQCNQLRILSATPASGQVESSGVILDQPDGMVLAEFKLNFSLQRGSRLLCVQGSIKPQQRLSGSPWQNYIAARAVVAGEAAIFRPLVRDKVHRASSRRMIAPLGVVIDESERQTLVAAHGNAAHRRVADRFLDTLLMVAQQTEYEFTLSYGFDVREPVAAARSAIVPPPRLDVQTDGRVSPLGWIMHVTPGSVLINWLQTGRRGDGRDAAVVRLVQTRPQPITATVRFPVDVATAIRLTGVDSEPLEQPLPAAGHQQLAVQDDRVSVPMAAHAIIDLLVVFEPSGRPEADRS